MIKILSLSLQSGGLETFRLRKLFQNFARAGNQAPMPIEDWKKLQDTIPALKTVATEDIMS